MNAFKGEPIIATKPEANTIQDPLITQLERLGYEVTYPSDAEDIERGVDCLVKYDSETLKPSQDWHPVSFQGGYPHLPEENLCLELDESDYRSISSRECGYSLLSDNCLIVIPMDARSMNHFGSPCLYGVAKSALQKWWKAHGNPFDFEHFTTRRHGIRGDVQVGVVSIQSLIDKGLARQIPVNEEAFEKWLAQSLVEDT